MRIGAAGRADAADANEDDTSPPSPALLVMGVVVAGGGGALQYVSARHFADNPSSSVGWLALSSVGSLTSELGGALTAFWGWRLGENHFAFDRAGGVPIQERRSMALTAVA